MSVWLSPLPTAWWHSPCLRWWPASCHRPGTWHVTPRSCGLGTRDARTWVWRRAGGRGTRVPCHHPQPAAGPREIWWQCWHSPCDTRPPGWPSSPGSRWSSRWCLSVSPHLSGCDRGSRRWPEPPCHCCSAEKLILENIKSISLWTWMYWQSSLQSKLVRKDDWARHFPVRE